MGELQERITSTREGSVTSIQAIYVPADDLTDPAPASVFAHLNATTTLTRSLVEQGIYPAVDPLDSTSTILKPDILGEEHYETATRVQETLQRYKELQDIIAILGDRRALRRGQADGLAGAEDPALPHPAVLRRRAVHRPQRRVRAGRRDGPRLQGDRRRRARRHPRARLLHAGRDRAGARGGEEHGGARTPRQSAVRREAEEQEARRREATRLARWPTSTPSTPRSSPPRARSSTGDVQQLSTRTAVGEIGILANHVPVLARLRPTELRLHMPGGETQTLGPGRGLAAGLRQPGDRAGRRGDPPDQLDEGSLKSRIEDAEAAPEASPRRAPAPTARPSATRSAPRPSSRSPAPQRLSIATVPFNGLQGST